MTRVACHHCGYEWEYSGDLCRATCPSCGRKTPVEDDDAADESDGDTEGDTDRRKCYENGYNKAQSAD